MSIPSLIEFLKAKGWDVPRDDFVLNNASGEYIKIEGGRLEYYTSNKAELECPLDIMIHHLEIFEDYNNYKKGSGLIEMLKNRGYQPLYGWHSYRLPAIPDDSYGFTGFNSIVAYSKEPCIRCEPETGVRGYSRDFTGDFLVEDEVLENIVLELIKLLDPEFTYDLRAHRFHIPDVSKQKQIY